MWKSIFDLEKLNSYRASSSLNPYTDEYFVKYMEDQRYILGKGGFGKAFRIDQSFTLKKINDKKKSTFVSKCLENEKNVLQYMLEKNLEHVNLAKVFFIKDNITIYEFLFATVTNVQFSSNLYQFIRAVDPEISLSIILKNNLFKQIYDGLSYLHVNNIYHRDIKPDNIMLTGSVNGDMVVKIIDYNLAYLFEPQKDNKNLFLPGNVGAPIYRSPVATGFDTSKPEECKLYFILSDLWCFIITFYELIYIDILFIDVKKKQTYSDYLLKGIITEEKKESIKDKYGCDFDIMFKFMLKQMCDIDNSLRIVNFNAVILQIMNISKFISILSYSIGIS